MEVNLVAEGVKFMVLGMTVVFSFLIFLVFVLKLQAKIVLKFFPPEEGPACRIEPKASNNDANQVVAVIAAAIKKYRND